MTRHTIIAIGTLWSLTACAADLPRTLAEGEVLAAQEGTQATNAWAGLMQPVAITVTPQGIVAVADDGEGKIYVFDRIGAPLRSFGGTGGGPGEMRRVRALTATEEEIRIFDASTNRYLRYSINGEFKGSSPLESSGDQMVAAIGSGFLVASNARWSTMPPVGQSAWPLARVIDSVGETLFEIGERQPATNPLVASIANFVIPAGSPDGKTAWLAFLNDPDIVMYSTESAATRTIQRSLPFDWQRLPENVTPAALLPEPGKLARLPYDVITYGIATDAEGRAFVLTALGANKAVTGEPTQMGVDVIDPDPSIPLRRITVKGDWTHIAVSPDGSVVYLLDTPTGAIGLFELPGI